MYHIYILNKKNYISLVNITMIKMLLNCYSKMYQVLFNNKIKKLN